MKHERKDGEKIQRSWESVYKKGPLEQLPWEEGRPSAELVGLIQSGIIERGAVLEVCCGSGTNAIYLAKHGFTSYGIDISPTAIAYAQDKAAQEAVNCNLIQGDATRLPYPDNAFTLVFDRGCFHSIQTRKRKSFIGGIHRVLIPGGKYQLLCFSSKDHLSLGAPYSFSPKDIRRYFSPKFKIHHIKELATGRNGVKHYFLSVLMEKTS
jgi:ubiquinone/menaquinone biosynthesis C-methylase UbiE